MAEELGGDAPCWAHLIDDPNDAGSPLVVDLDAVDTAGGPGAQWSLPHGGDLDANLVRLEPHGAIGSHVNTEVDVLVVVVDGAGEVEIDGVSQPVRRHALVLIPKGARREVRAHGDGVTYLTVHRRRDGLRIRSRG